MLKSLTTTNSTSPNDGKKCLSDLATVMSQRTTLSQLMEQVSEIKQSHKTMLNWFDQLAAQMALLISNSTSSPKKCPAGGHNSESSQAT